jgi:2,4-dienoyl-CoA reductase (NADPH2)
MRQFAARLSLKNNVEGDQVNTLKSLFEPIIIGQIELKNRIVMPAMGIGAALCPEGRITERFKSLYAERARGGVGLIVCSISAYPEPGGKVRGVAVHKDEYIPGLRGLTDAVHTCGGKIAAQLVQRVVWRKQEDAAPERVGPSDIAPGPGGRPGPKIRPLSLEEIEQIVEETGKQAHRIRDAGFDAIEIHANVGHSLASYFISRFTNRRTDRYGGSVENRYRLLLEMLNSARKQVGKDYTITCRISGADFLEGGSNLEDSKTAAPMLEKAGFDAINVTTGWFEAPVAFVQQGVPQGEFVYLAQEIKKVVKIPVIGGTSICDPRFANRLIADGKIDLVYMARPLLADSELPNKARDGRFKDIRPCILCCRCMDSSDAGEAVSCTVNARLGKEVDYPVIGTAKVKKRVLVVGGGPAGMETARVAALRGHEVILYEMGPRLGGAMTLASIVNPELQRLVRCMEWEIIKLPIRVITGKEVTTEVVVKIGPDVVVLATGGASPERSTTKLKNVLSSNDILHMVQGGAVAKGGILRSILWKGAGLLFRYSYNPALIRWLSQFRFPFGKNVVIIGGGLAGCELATFLLERRRTVAIIGESTRIGDGVGPTNRWVFRMKFKEHKVRMLEMAKVEEITEKGVKVKQGDSTVNLTADTIVLARELQSNRKLADGLKSKVTTIYSIGDCASPALIKEAISQGFVTGMGI